MAKQVEDIVVRLVGEGFEALDKIKGSFRELGKVTNLAEKDILSARDSLSEFAKKAGNTEAVNKGLIDAFKGLRSQVDVNSAAYRSFSTDIARLETELRGSTAAIDRQRTSLLSNAAAGKENVSSLQRQVAALRQLQQETRPGSSAFLQLGKDIDNVTIKLGKLKSEAQAFNLALGQQAGATPEVLNRQIATLQKGLQSVRFDAEQFVETLRKIQLLQITQTGRTGRAGVIADFEAYRSREFTGGYADPSRLAAMPDTTAALNQELSELTKRLDNVSRGGTDYVAVSLRIADIQRQLRTELIGTTEAFRRLDLAQTGAERRAGKVAQVQEYFAESRQGGTRPRPEYDLPPGTIDPATGARIARGKITTASGGIRPGTQYDQPIGPQPVNPAFAAFESSMKQTQDRITSIYDDAYVRRTQLQADFNQISIDKLLTGLDMEGQVRNAAFGRELADFDKQLEARDRRRRRRPSTGQLVQAGGAAISGGIFGGPEGFLGGVGGAVLGTALPGIGTVGGAFAGAAAGAQVAGLRQAGASAAAYAAEIRRLQLALQGIVSSFDDYKAALAAVESTSNTFNVPIREATQQFTKLSAAVLGSGGTIKDAENTFKGLTASVLATGGSVEDVNGALVAAAQVFSKGKVTAEELRGQIGERLAGAFALFAESSGRSTKGLDAALKSGEVTIADFVKFTEFSLAKYGRTAEIIAASPEQAGARLDRALKKLQQNVGDSLGPTGAAFQDFVARSVRGLDRIINKLIELKALQPGAGYYQQQVLEGSLSIPQLEDRLLRAGQQETTLRQGAASAGLGFIADLLPDISAATKEARILEEALIKLRVIEKETNKERKERKVEEDAADKERLGAALLQAIEQREEALLNLRTQREEQLAQIREQAVEQAKQIETQLADRRLAIERQIQDIKRQSSDFIEDSERRIREASGESSDRIADEQRIADIFREERDSRIQSERTLADDKKQQEETIAEFQRGVAESINDANRAHTKSMGEIQKQYANSVAKIIDEGTGKAGKRLEKAAQLAAAFIQRGTANSQIAAVTSGIIPERRQGVYDFTQVGGKGATTPAKLLNIPGFEDVQGPLKTILKLDDIIESLQKGLNLSRTPVSSGSFDISNLATDFGQIASASFIGGLLAQNSGAPRPYQVGDTIPGPPAARRTAYPIPVIPSAEQTTQLRNAQDQTEEQARQAKTAQQIKEAFAGVNAESAQFTNGLNEQLDLLGSQRKFLDMGFSDSLSKDLANLDKSLATSKVRLQDIATDLKNRGSDPATVDALEKAAIARAQELYNINVKLTQELEKQAQAMRLRQDDRIGLGIREGALAYVESIGTMREATAQLTQTGIKGVEDALFSLVTTGKANFREFAVEILKQSARMVLQLTIQRVLMQIIGAIGGGSTNLGDSAANVAKYSVPLPNAMGNAFTANNIVPYAMGGVVSRPTLFKFANGGTTRTGLMGEAGPEAIIPLKRGPDGKLGVSGGGGGAPVNVTVNVDASGSGQVAGDSGQGAQLGRLVAGAVQAELLKQKRPGGLLAA